MAAMTNDKIPAANLKQALRLADMTQAELIRSMRKNREGLACSEAYMSKINNGLKPGSQYQAAINRALAKRGVEIKWAPSRPTVNY